MEEVVVHQNLGEVILTMMDLRVEAVALPLTPATGLTSGMPVTVLDTAAQLHASPAVLGRVLDALGEPVDGGPPLPADRDWPLSRPAPDPLTRRPIERPLPLGVRVVDAVCTLGAGQRIGLQAGPGAGKTTLLAQVADPYQRQHGAQQRQQHAASQHPVRAPQ